MQANTAKNFNLKKVVYLNTFTYFFSLQPFGGYHFDDQICH